jgi:hypothetical protein
MSDLLKRLLAYLTLAVDGEVDPEPEPTPAADDLESLLDAGDPDPEPVKEKEDSATVRELKLAREELEFERRRVREMESRPAPAPQSRDPDYDREEQEIKQARDSGATAEQISWLQWKIDSSRKMRASERTSQNALQQAADINDKTDFAGVARTHPKTYDKYKDRVEEAVQKLRAAGSQVPPRRAIMEWFIGKDSMNGTIKPKSAKAPAEPTGKTVDRGRTPGARTDVSANRGSLSERDKRRERLRNQQI